MMINHTPDGILVTGKTIRFGILVVGAIGMLLGGIIAAVRFVDRAGDTVPRQEFVEHVRSDSAIHAMQNIHDTFQDSLIRQGQAANYRLLCRIARNPVDFCGDVPVSLLPVRP